ncbi:hypothetical protein BGZ91_003963 [Linnemannia elongata]|nr:hypothetical protein BGZ91_003963 [Linnemannia elongata]
MASKAKDGRMEVGLKQGCGADFLISIGLTLLGHVPGIGYAWYIIYKNRDDPNLSHRHGRTYVAVPQQQYQQQQQPQNYQATAPVPQNYQATAPVPQNYKATAPVN